LQADGVEFDSDNDSEVGARFLASRLEQGEDLEKALRVLVETFDGFFTLVVSTADSLAVVRDRVACKPLLVAESADWVAVASEYRALSELPGIDHARISEPEPARVSLWQR
jgi:glutamine phosphoribosylpyrophosphate amidotransferase